jgi:hypothetical protein
MLPHNQLPRENYPPIQRRSALFATATGFDPNGVRRALDEVTQSYFVFLDESWETHLVPPPFRPGLFSLRLIRHYPIPSDASIYRFSTARG